MYSRLAYNVKINVCRGTRYVRNLDSHGRLFGGVVVVVAVGGVVYVAVGAVA